ncbi:hypothetical protein [Rossellomorea arthrocnemi]|uniref:hypothetical protein n=1 Tax=Rossellomorea arthrocnemi TaxID=2769542 RepID=UPI001E438E96|nr:hypothetical protein [Rossellomorea arthrocnemi]
MKELSHLFEERIERHVWHECHRHTLGLDEYDCGHFFLVLKNERGDQMGFYYFAILVIGVFLVFGAGLQAFKQGSFLKPRVFLYGGMGVVLIGLSIFMFTPGSADLVAELLGLTEG